MTGRTEARCGDSAQPGRVASVVDEWFATVAVRHHGRSLALFVERSTLAPAMVRIVPEPVSLPSRDYPLELRFASWLASLESRQVRAVPTYLLPWFPFSKALILPLCAGGRVLGALALDVTGLERSTLSELAQATEQLALELSTAVAPHSSARDSLPELFVESMRRIKLDRSER